MSPNLKALSLRYNGRIAHHNGAPMPQPEDFDCGFKEGDIVRLPSQSSSQRRGTQNRGTVVLVEDAVLTNLKGQPYQMVKVKDLRSKVDTWASTVLVKACFNVVPATINIIKHGKTHSEN